MVLGALHVHPSRQHDLVVRESLQIEPALPVETYRDVYDNEIARIAVPEGVDQIRLSHRSLIRDNGLPDATERHARQHALAELPPQSLQFLLASRYCEVDSELMAFAWDRFGMIEPGWARVEAICEYVHEHIQFDYQQARANRTALEAWRERAGVCRDFAHLAVTLCRCMNIPARYTTGYLGDIGVEPLPSPMDFSAWFEVYLGDRWHTFDARHNARRIGRVVMAYGRDAADVPITMVFGPSTLKRFEVVTEEVASVIRT